MPIDKAMELIYNLIHEQSESLTSDQLEALNLGLSALKTIADFKLNNVSRETILGKKLIDLSEYDCTSNLCSECKYYNIRQSAFPSPYECSSVTATQIIHLLEKEIKA